MKKPLLYIIILVIAAGIVAAVMRNRRSVQTVPILSFADCAKAGYPIMGSYPAQCRTPDGRLFTEEVAIQPTYANGSTTDIVVTTPFPGGVTGKTFSVIGKARGPWYFEATFLLQVVAENGTVLATTPVHAQGDWMVTGFVPFKADITIPASYTGKAIIILKKDNPSGDPARDASLSIPITVEY
jgi:hypothetical protein